MTFDCNDLNLVTVDCHDPTQTADYLKIGTPLQFILWLTSTWVLSTSSLWYVSLAVTTVVLVVVATVRLGGEGWRNRLKQGAGKNRHDS